MSKIKVDTIQSTQHSASTISLTSTGATVNGDCTATTFSGSGASLTSLPSANLTGAIPANLLTNAGGGALEFVSKTTISSNTSEVDFTGLDYGFIYKIVGKKLEFSGSGGQYPNLAPFVNGATSPITNSACTYSLINRGGTTGGSIYGYTAWQLYDDGYFSAVPYAFSAEFSTDYYPRMYAEGHSYQTNGYSFSLVRGHFNSNITSESNVSSESTVRISGMRFNSSSGWYITSGEILLYKYKES
tara:strand:- start:854 stop:1585 length:732 start_codon:yes stop_codon:yes gene_type:complete